MKFDPARFAFFVTVTVLVVGGAFTAGILSEESGNDAARAVTSVRDAVAFAFNQLDEEKNTITRRRPDHFLQPSRHEGSGVTTNAIDNDPSALILIAGFFEDDNGIRLIERTGRILVEWRVSYSDFFPDPVHRPDAPATDWNIDTHGALALPDGSVVFNFEYGGTVALDRCGNTLWTLDRMTHHSIEHASGGGYWTLGRRPPPERGPVHPPFPEPYWEDTILRVSASGDIEEISIPDLFYRSGMEALLTSTGDAITREMSWDKELVHANKVAELPADLADDFPLFEAGDLVISLRKYNLLLVADPNSRRIKWWQIGPWIRQHDPEFLPGGEILVFNNNTYRTKLDTDDFASNIMTVDPVSGETRILYGNRPGERLATVLRGKVEYLGNQRLLITEFEGGRVLETRERRVVWEYVNRFDDDSVAEVTEARLYDRDYFDVSDWSCPAQ